MQSETNATKVTVTQIREAVLNAAEDVFAIDRTSLDDTTRIVEDLGADSMAIVTLMISLNDELDVALEFDDLPKSEASIRWIVEALYERISDKSSRSA